MVFISVIAGREQLFTSGIDGSSPRQLTHDDADHEDPAWSPDGKRIAFVLKQRELEQIHLTNADGTGVEPLTPKEVRTIHPNWSPDSRRVIYCTDDDIHPPQKESAEIDSIDVTSRHITKLISGGVNTYPAWSPDAKKIAFRRMLGENNSEVFVANSDGSDARNLTNDPAFDGWPAWSPDGSQIAFASNRNRNYEIYVMNADGTGVQKVANTEGRATAPQWGKDGKTIYFPICMKVDFGADCQIYAAKTDAARGRAAMPALSVVEEAAFRGQDDSRELQIFADSHPLKTAKGGAASVKVIQSKIQKVGQPTTEVRPGAHGRLVDRDVFTLAHCA